MRYVSTRRTVLKAIGVASAIRGTVSAGADERVTTNSGWPMFQRDAANTGHDPRGVGPLEDVAEAWHTSTGTAGIEQSPVVVGDSVFVEANNDGVICLDATDGTERWRYDTPDSVKGTLVVADGRVFASSGEILFALDAADGTELWAFEADHAVGGQSLGTPTVADGTVYVGGKFNDFNLYALDTASGERRWTFEGPTDIGPAPAIEGDSVYVCSHHLLALDRASGEQRWVTEFGDREWARYVAVVDDSLYVVTPQSVYEFDAATGDERWSATLGRLLYPPAVTDTTVYVSNHTGSVYALAADSGDIQWKFDTSRTSRVYKPVVVGGTVYLGVDDLTEALYALEANTGDVRWSLDTSALSEGTVSSSLAVADGTVYAGVGSAVVAIEGSAGRRASLSLRAQVLDGGGDDPARVISGGEVSITLELTNDGGDTAENPSVVVRLPPQWEAIEYDAEAGGWNEGTDAWLNSSLEAGATVTPGLTVAVPEGAAGTYEITAEARQGTDVVDTATVTLEAVRVAAGPADPEVVQTVADTHLSHTGRLAPDPPLVPDRPASVLFAVEGTDLEALPADATLPVQVVREGPGGTATDRVDLPREAVLELADEIAEAAPPAEVFQALPADARPPVFDLPGDLETLTVRLGDEVSGVDTGIDGNTARVSVGDDVDVADGHSLSVGYVELRDGTGGTNYGDPDANGRFRVGATDQATPDDWFATLVETTDEYLRRTFPVTSVTSIRHHRQVAGTGDCGDYRGDLRAAYDALVDTYGDDFDVTVAIAPQDYFAFHADCDEGLDGSTAGLELTGGGVAERWRQPQTAAVAVAFPRRPGVTAAVVAQEVGHHFLGPDVYPDALAQRDDPDATGSPTAVDNSHARTEYRRNADGTVIDAPALRSRAFDLFDGTYTLFREGGDEGFWGSEVDLATGDGSPTLGSFMSYSSDDVWADAHAYRTIAEDGLEPTPPEEELGIPVVPVLAGRGRVTDDGVEVTRLTAREGRPSPPGGDGDLTVEATDSEGSVLDSRTLSTGVGILGHGGRNYVAGDELFFTAPLPEGATSVALRHGGDRTEVDPVTDPLRAAIERVPDRGFAGDPDERRSALLDTVSAVERQTEDGERRAAADALDDLRADVEAWLREDYPAAANEYTKDELLSLVDRLRTWLVGSRRSGWWGGLADWLPVVGGAAGLGLAGAVYGYLRRRGQTDDEGNDGSGDQEG